LLAEAALWLAEVDNDDVL